MQFLLLHWHCILPAAAILISLFFMGKDRKPQDKSTAAKLKIQDSLNEKE
jgi:hypothetical protein